jgi:hypothetical protein
MATNFTHTMGKTYKSDAGTVASTTQSFTGDAEIQYKGAIAANTTDGRITLAVTKANIRSMVIYCDQDCTIKTNSSTTPQETISVSAKVMVDWNTSSTASCPYSGNITDLYVTVGNTSAAANLLVTHLVDQTPVLGDPA